MDGHDSRFVVLVGSDFVWALTILGLERGDFDRLVLGGEREPVRADDLRQFRHQLRRLLLVHSNGEREHGLVLLPARPERCVEASLNKLDL
jgi:hypothetical protein